MSSARGLLTEIAHKWTLQPVTLDIIGATALALVVGYDRGTKDADVLKTVGLCGEAQTHLLELAGPGTALARRWKMHAELVDNGIPFLPRPTTWQEIELVDVPATVQVRALGVIDVVVSKLKRFSSNDRTDIAAMISAGHVDHTKLVAKFRSAVDEFACDARADDLPLYVRNLHTIERDLFIIDETEIALPDWID